MEFEVLKNNGVFENEVSKDKYTKQSFWISICDWLNKNKHLIKKDRLEKIKSINPNINNREINVADIKEFLKSNNQTINDNDEEITILPDKESDKYKDSIKFLADSLNVLIRIVYVWCE